MARPRRLSAPLALSALVLALGCAGPPIPAPIEGLPVCPDFTSGNAKMEGGLRFPVRMRVLDGSLVLFKTVLTGLRHPDDPPPRTFIVDDNARYTVEWAQCSNPRAPRSVSELAQTPKAREKAHDGEGTGYECGDATVYKADAVLQTKKGDRASHTIPFVAPPNPACWAPDALPAPSAAPDAGAPATADAGAAPASSDAGAPAATDAGTAPPSSATGDAGAAHDAGAK